MHRIESLEILGFKSFRNKVQIAFEEDISAIVGPNGCGKSNVCDAFLWVMGEQSARVLRGNRMEDVIFNGTERFRPLGFTEVTLHLKYVDSPGEEDFLAREDLEIKRRLYRDGVSEYSMNGKRCRLMDIHATFEGTGLGFTSYAIIEQGRIQNITSSKPLELRALIEEAARIVSFKQRKKSAIIKLEMAEQNLLRIHDIIQEIERGLKSLKVQSRRARRYNSIREQMRIFLKIHYFKLADSLKARFDENQKQINSLDEDVLAAENEFQKLSEILHQTRSRLLVEEDRNEQLQQQDKEVQLNLQKITTAKSFLNEQQRNLTERGKNIATESHRINARLKEQQKHQCELEEKIEHMNLTQEETKERFEKIQHQFQKKDAHLTNHEKKLENLRNQVFEEAGLLSNWRNQETHLLEQEKWVIRQRKKLEHELSEYESQANRLNQELSDGKELLENLVFETDDLEVEMQRIEDEQNQYQKNRASLKQQCTSLEKEVGAHQHRLSSLEELEARHEFYSDTVKEFLPLLSSDPAFQGTLADYIEAGEGFEAVVENYLREELETMVVNSVDLVDKGLFHVRSKRGGMCRFLIKDAGVPPKPSRMENLGALDGVLGKLVDVLKLDDKGRNLLTRAASGIDNVWLVKDWRTAVAIALERREVTCLSLDGVEVNSTGRITVHGDASVKGILGYRLEKKEIAVSLKTGVSQLSEIEQSLTELEATLNQLDTRQEQLNDSLQDARTTRIRQQESNKRTFVELDRYTNLAATTRAEIDNIMAEETRIGNEIEQVRERISEMAQGQKLRQNEYERCREQIMVLKEEVATLNREYSEVRTEYSTVKERWSSSQNELDQLNLSIEDMESSDKNLNQEQSKIKDQLARIDADLLSSDSRYKQAFNQRQEVELKLEDQKKTLSDIRERINRQEMDMDARRRVLDDIREQKNHFEVERAKIESELSYIEESCLREFHHSMEQISIHQYEKERDLAAEEAYEKYLAFRTKAEKMGSVNLVAMEEYEREEERFLFHKEQEKDISDSIKSTQEAIKEIDKHSMTIFKETFHQVNKNFREMFETLFGGGFCELRLEDEEDILESGVEIVASPPGKKLQNILLLSGGEKALTALALLLAIFKYRPSPFCIMDEVDAPLDDNNIDRFVSLVREMSAQTQYILITHNKRTMEIGQTIYGITMEVPGISKVLSVKLKDAEAVLAG